MNAIVENETDKRDEKKDDKKVVQKLKSFEIDPRITCKLDYDLAIEIGQFILKTGTDNPAIYAWAIQLVKLEKN